MSDVAVAVASRTNDVVGALRALDDESLPAPSLLPGWSRLTIACHLRYGADALVRVTTDALDGAPTSYYPEGRAVQRPGTLEPRAGESPKEVVESLAQLGARLDALWLPLDDRTWDIRVVEPAENPDLGTRTLHEMAVLRLTEVEVHGTDLDVGLPDWSDVFVRTALPLRMERLRSRPIVEPVQASWHFDVSDGPSYRVTVEGTTVVVDSDSHAADATVRLETTSRDLLAILLGRPTDEPALVEAFRRIFPGP